MKNIYVTGFIGSDRYSLGRQLAEEKGMELIILDKFIEELDGRSVMRIIRCRQIRRGTVASRKRRQKHPLRIHAVWRRG